MPSSIGFHYDTPGAFYDAGLVYDAEPIPVPKPKTKMASLNLSLSRKNVQELITLGELVSTSLAPAAPATPPIPNMAAKVTALGVVLADTEAKNTAYEEAKSALVTLKQARDAATDDLKLELTALARAVEAEAKGNATMLASSGFTLAAEASSTNEPPSKILNLNVTASDADGQLDVQHDPAARARTYELQLCTVDPVTGPWETKCSQTTSRCTVFGLTSGQRVWIRVRGLGPNGNGPWSDPFTKIVP